MRKPRRARSNPTVAFGLMALVLLGGAGLLLLANTAQQSSAKIGGAFTLIDGAGHQVTQADLRGRYALIYFGYTDCPDVCPTTLAQMASAMDMLGPAVDRVQPVFITVDPTRDTPDVIARYTAEISPRLLGLTGSPEAIAKAERAFHVTVTAESGGALDHSAVMYLMGPSGALLAPIRADTPGPAIAATISRYMS